MPGARFVSRGPGPVNRAPAGPFSPLSRAAAQRAPSGRAAWRDGCATDVRTMGPDGKECSP